MSPLRPPTGHVFRVERASGAVWYAKYRLPDGRQVQKKIGPAWGERGRPPVGWFTKRTAEAWLRDQMDLYEQYGWSWAYWAFREWDVMNIERTADAADKVNRPDTPLLRLFKTYFAQNKQFPGRD